MPSDQLPNVSPTLLVRQEAGRRELEVYVGSSSSCKRVGATHTQLSHINGNLRKEGKVSPVKALSPRLGKASWHASKLHPDYTASMSLLDDTFPLPAFPHASIPHCRILHHPSIPTFSDRQPSSTPPSSSSTQPRASSPLPSFRPRSRRVFSPSHPVLPNFTECCQPILVHAAALSA